MPITNTAAFAQYRRIYQATLTTANGGTLAIPTNYALLSVAGPDGALITKASAVPRATVTNSQIQLYLSKDGATTFGLISGTQVAAATIGLTASISTTPLTQIDGTTLSETNPLALSGVTDFGTTAPTWAGLSSGSVNAQLLPFATSVTALTAGLVIDFEVGAGLTNTSSTTLTVGTSAATSLVRDATGAAVSAGDLTAGFRYRARCDGTFWRLFITDRLYVATGVTLADGIVVTAEQADF